MKQKVAPQSRKNDVVVQDLNGEVLIYDLKSNKAFCLNETSAIVWQACDGNKSVDEISQAVSKKLNQPANEDLVWLALDQLKKENLLDNSEEIVPNFNGVSRREVIKKVGLATMIALPIVTGLVAPKAAMAQSLAAICAAQDCECVDTFAQGNATGTPCTGVNLSRGCATVACTCVVRTGGSAAGSDRCTP